ncbi:unnamed protein product (macronuclear) [Paramecium tetraurelia]|uniref:Uncharacterized protein n=1 Tax=Paramecium tetraurelia TaxID=5888 RepID=A0DXE9_PARTE|nr:uncharacterized protein GSPATT00021349001 [Paramecium tetraurelia]CAK87716.1 unnamed protein product [Paramecium tetraurelia]|eukprot:XP_001455113.1 hypothetical protein (macronuclear) [Paramecium tetraurelia strain d4-2]
MYLLTLLEIILVTIYCAKLINNICCKEVNIIVRVTCLISWLTNFILLILLPLDIYVTFRDQETNSNQSDLGVHSREYEAIGNMYQILYWANFILCWTIIPIMQEYEEATDLNQAQKLMRSLINNGKFFLVIGIAGIVFIVIIVMTGQASDYGLTKLLKSMANSFGVALIIVLLGYSLIAVPRAHMRTSTLDVQMKYLYFKTAKITEEKDEAQHELQEKAKRVVGIRNQQKFQQESSKIYLKISIKTIPKTMYKDLVEEDAKSKAPGISYLQRMFFKEQPEATDEEMVEIYRDIRQKARTFRRLRAAWKENCRKAYALENVINSVENSDKKIHYDLKSNNREGSCSQQLDTLEWYWLCYYKPQFKILFSLFLGILSLLVVISETTLFMNTPFTIFGMPISLSSGVIALQIFCFVPLFYIAFCVYYGMFRIKIAGCYGLYDDHQTDAPSLLFATINFSRVAAPLCQNFLNMLRVKQRLNCEPAFKYAMGEMEFVPIFGVNVIQLMPALLLFLCFINYFDLYDRFMNFLGLKEFMFTETFSDRLIFRGRDALKDKKAYFIQKKSKVQKGTKKEGDIELLNIQ